MSPEQERVHVATVLCSDGPIKAALGALAFSAYLRATGRADQAELAEVINEFWESIQ